MTASQPVTPSGTRPGNSKLVFWLELLLVAGITALAIFLRTYHLEQAPPGFNSDEAVGAVGALETLRHGPRLFYAGQGGGGSLGFFIAAIGFALFGPSVATIRGTAAFAGVVSVVAAYFATREMFRHNMAGVEPARGLDWPRALAALTALGLAISLWHTQSSRVAFAAIGVPFLQVPANYFLWRGLNTGRRVHFVLSGVLLASLMYIYLSGSFAPFVYLLFFLLQWLLAVIPWRLSSRARESAGQAHPPVLLKQHFWNLVLCAGVAFVLFLPMVYLYLTAPELATERAQQALFTNPRISQGDPLGTLWRSLWGNLAAFGMSLGWLQGRPPANLILPVPLAILFLLGFGISLWRVRRPPYLFTLVYWGVMLVPSILSPDSIPHSLRAVGAAPATCTLVAIGVMGIVELALAAGAWRRRGGRPDGEPAAGRQPGFAPYLLLGAVLLATGLVLARPLARAYHYYFVEWPATNDAQAAYHVYAVELARDMSRETDPQATFLLPRDTAAGDVNPNYTVMFLYTGQAGYAWVVDDEDSLEATLQEALQGRDVVHVVRWKASKHTGADPKEAVRYYLEKHGRFLEQRAFDYYDIDTYRLDSLGPDVSDSPLTPTRVDFGDQITLTGYAYGDASGADDVNAPSVPAGDLLWARLRFRLEAPSPEDLKASLMVTDGAGHVVGQIDKLLLNNILHQGSAQWQPGTSVDAYYLVPVAPASPPGDYRLGLAVYGAESLARLPAPAGDSAGMVSLGEVSLQPDQAPPAVDDLGLSLVLNQPLTDALTLLGVSSSAGEQLRPGERATLALAWRAERPLPTDYRASLWAVRGEGAWPLTPALPLAGRDYPATRWAAGQVVRGWFDGRIPPDMESGDYALVVRLTDPRVEQVAEAPLGSLQVAGWPRQFEAPPMQTKVEGNFGDLVELLGYDLEIPPATGDAGSVKLSLYWRALSEMETSYTTFVHVLNQAGQVVSQVDHVPGDGAFPTSGWLPGEVIPDRFELALPVGQSPADLQIELGLYDPATGERLSVLDETGRAVDNRLLLLLRVEGE